MDHTEIRRKLPAYLDDDVSAEEKQEIKRHLGTCGICRGALADLELTMWHLRRLPEVEPPPWLSEKILSRVRSPAEPRPRPWLSSRPLFKLAIALLVLLLLCGIGYLVYRTLKPVVTPSPPVTREVTPALPASAGAPSPVRVPAPRREAPPLSAPASPEAPPVLPPPEGEASLPTPAPIPAAAPKRVPSPAPALPGEPELPPAGEEALPGREAVQPFGQEEQGSPQGAEMEKHPQRK